MSHAFLITYYVSNTAARNIKYVWKAFRGCLHEPGYLASRADSCHEILSSAAKGHLKHSLIEYTSAYGNIDLIEYTSAYSYRDSGTTRFDIARHLLV